MAADRRGRLRGLHRKAVTHGDRPQVDLLQFVWPFMGDFRIGREKRGHVWIMARQPTLPDADYRRLAEMLRCDGYATARIQRVPQRREPEATPAGE